MKRLFFISLLLLPCFSFGQNLVPNPSFEVYDTCPDFYNQVNRSIPWFNPTTGTSDYFNACDAFISVPANFMGYQDAKTGQGYCGFFPFYYAPQTYREYIEVKLLDSLQAGTKYFVSFYVSLADSMQYATDDIGIYFSPDSISADTFDALPYVPQISNVAGNILSDKLNWTQISGSFIAGGGEKYITVGNFKNDLNTDTVFVGGGINQADYKSAYYYIDDVCVSPDSLTCLDEVGIDEKSREHDLTVYPNPTEGKFRVESLEFGVEEIQVYDLFGRLLLRSNKEEIDMSSFPKGLYFVRVGEATLKLIIQ